MQDIPPDGEVRPRLMGYIARSAWLSYFMMKHIRKIRFEVDLCTKWGFEGAFYPLMLKPRSDAAHEIRCIKTWLTR
jgi:hypothetical protein